MRQRRFPFVLLSLVVALTCLKLQEQQANGQDSNRLTRSAEWLLPIPEMEAAPNIPTSKSLLGYHWGEEISNYEQVKAYLEALHRAAPERTRLVQYGTTYEDRPLHYLVVSSEGNIARLEEIRAQNLRLADPTSDLEVSEQSASSELPAVVWLAYSVHGNEISCTDAALLTAYHFVADEREVTRQMMRDVVLIIDPLQNPDGRERFVSAYREARGLFPQANPFANEHTERWPGGRQNHYWFDMNRDWFRQSQRETQAKVSAFFDWMPQIYVDAHEMGRNSTYYFAPPADPVNPYILPRQRDWFFRIGRHQAGRFDQYGFSYTTREMYDAFYPGYGSEWPTLHGGIGILWEQAGARGIVVDRDDESSLAYHDGVRHHYVSGISTVEVAAQHRAKLLHDFRDARRQSMRIGEEGDVRHFFLLAGSNRDRAEALAEALQRNGIAVFETTRSCLAKVVDPRSGESRDVAIPTGSLHVPVGQPTGRLIRTLLDHVVEMDPAFVQRQLARNEHRLPDEIYDVTAWSLPLAYGVKSIATNQVTDFEGRTWEMESTSGRMPDEPAVVAYLIRPTDRAMPALADLHRRRIRVHVADRSLQFGDADYPRGTLIIKANENDEDLFDKLKLVADDHRISIEKTDSGFVTAGAHLGGPFVSWVKPPKVLIVCQTPVSYSVGHTWFLLDQILKYPSTRVAANRLAAVQLDAFDVIVLSEGSYRGDDNFDESFADELRTWISSGGTLITAKGATRWAAADEIGLLANRIVEKSIEPADEEGEPIEVSPDNAPGAFLNATTFQEHFVTYGMRREITPFFTGRLILGPTPANRGRDLVTFAGQERLISSGFCWPSNIELQADTPYVVGREIGDGHVISFTDDPNFRVMYPETQRLFINALMFGPSF